MEEKLVKCVACGKETQEWNINREGECRDCQMEEKVGEMRVGDYHE